MLTIYNLQFSSVAQSCLTPCDPMNRSKPGFPVHHQLLEVTQILFIESVMPSNHLIFCRPLLLPPSIFPSMRVFSNDSALCIWWPRYWPPASVLSMNSQCWFPLEWTGCVSLQSKAISLYYLQTSRDFSLFLLLIFLITVCPLNCIMLWFKEWFYFEGI